jgi:hypothetical protein
MVVVVAAPVSFVTVDASAPVLEPPHAAAASEMVRAQSAAANVVVLIGHPSCRAS